MKPFTWTHQWTPRMTVCELAEKEKQGSNEQTVLHLYQFSHPLSIRLPIERHSRPYSCIHQQDKGELFRVHSETSIFTQFPRSEFNRLSHLEMMLERYERCSKAIERSLSNIEQLATNIPWRCVLALRECLLSCI